MIWQKAEYLKRLHGAGKLFSHIEFPHTDNKIIYKRLYYRNLKLTIQKKLLKGDRYKWKFFWVVMYFGIYL